jgi:glutaminase
MDADRALDPALVSTGTLPAAARVRALVDEAYDRYRENAEGASSQVYPALARVDPALFGICVVGASGNVHAAGDADVDFALMSVAKPFVFALACHALGADELRGKIGVDGTGLPFDSLAAVERSPDGRTNPMVNAGAIATTSLLPGAGVEERWRFLSHGLSRFAGRELALDEETYRSASETNMRNRGIAFLLRARERIFSDPLEALDLYTRQSCLSVSARDLAVMGATLADGGVNPITGERVVDASTCRHTLAVMMTAGLYETSGTWLYDVGLPGKSGIGGGIVTVSPGKGGLGTFAPLLDGAGNSVKGQLVARFLSRRLGLDLFASEPVPPSDP